jgi:hypothetical protein
VSADRLLTPSDHYEQAQAELAEALFFHQGSERYAGAMALAQVHATLAGVPWAVYQQANEMRLLAAKERLTP